jgi:hypothetical protein
MPLNQLPIFHPDSFFALYICGCVGSLVILAITFLVYQVDCDDTGASTKFLASKELNEYLPLTEQPVQVYGTKE